MRDRLKKKNAVAQEATRRFPLFKPRPIVVGRGTGNYCDSNVSHFYLKVKSGYFVTYGGVTMTHETCQEVAGTRFFLPARQIHACRSLIIVHGPFSGNGSLGKLTNTNLFRRRSHTSTIYGLTEISTTIEKENPLVRLSFEVLTRALITGSRFPLQLSESRLNVNHFGCVMTQLFLFIGLIFDFV